MSVLPEATSNYSCEKKHKQIVKRSLTTLHNILVLLDMVLTTKHAINHYQTRKTKSRCISHSFSRKINTQTTNLPHKSLAAH